MRMPRCLWKIAGPVVPPGEEAVIVVETAEHVHQPPRHELAEGGPLGTAHVGGPANSAGSHTSRSSGATLKSPQTARGRSGELVSSSSSRSRANQANLAGYWSLSRLRPLGT